MRILGLVRITLLMFYRRKALRIASIPLALFALFLAYASPMSPGLNTMQGLVFTGQVLAIFTSLAYAASFSNLMTAGRRTGMDELESTSPLPMAVIRSAHILGAWVVCISSSLLFLVLIAIYQAFHGNGEAIIVALAVALVILSPSILIAMGISALLGALLPTVLARILGVLAWAWLAFYTPSCHFQRSMAAPCQSSAIPLPRDGSIPILCMYQQTAPLPSNQGSYPCSGRHVSSSSSSLVQTWPPAT